MTIRDARLWGQFVRGWLKLGLAVKDPRGFRCAVELRERHLAEASTPEFRARSQRLVGGTASMRDLVEYAKWELVECMDSVDPSPQVLGDVEDSFHAGCCAMRAYGALLRMEHRLDAEAAE